MRGPVEGGLALDAVNRKLVLVGGVTDGAPPCSTWSWDGTAWAETPGGGKPNTVLPPVWGDRGLLAMSVEIYDHAFVNRLWTLDVGPWKRIA